MKVLHIISGLTPNGAEGMLLKLIVSHQEMGVSAEVVSLTERGIIGERLSERGVLVTALNLRQSSSVILAIPRLCAIIRRFRPSLIQTWMPHADFIGLIVKAMFSNVPIVWNIRMSSNGLERWGTRFLANTLNKYLAPMVPRAIICCGQTVLEHYSKIGYLQSKLIVIPNGFDTNTFKPCVFLRDEMRRSLGLNNRDLLVGIVGRFHPMKDHRSFIEAASRVKMKVPNVRFMFVGYGLDSSNRELNSWIDGAGLRDFCFCIGRRTDLVSVYNAMDLNVLSSSSGEGFPNVLGEAMACGVPCISTDVGESRFILSGTGRTVPPSNAELLAEAIGDFLKLDVGVRVKFGRDARERILSDLSITAIANRYYKLYCSIVDRNGIA